MSSRLRLTTAASLLAVLGFAPSCGSASSHAAAPSQPAPVRSTPTASAQQIVAAGPQKKAGGFAGVSTVGALFPSAAVPLHICTASVVVAVNKSVIMTAAHCVRGGHDAGYVFAPGFHDGKAPYGFWRVTAAYGAPGWVKHKNDHDDFAFLTVAPRRINGTLTKLQTVTGAHLLASKPRRGDRVTVPGYPLGVGGSPIHCTATVFYRGAFPGFHCDGYVGGTSGSPWIEPPGHGRYQRVVGLIGGLHQGGCQSSTSYSSPLGKAAAAALERAGHSKPTDNFPSPPGDGC